MFAEARKQIAGNRLFGAAALPDGKFYLGMQRFAGADDGIVKCSERGNVGLAESGSGAPRRPAKLIGAEQKVRHLLGPLCPVSSFTYSNSRSRWALHKACVASSSFQYGAQQSCTSTPTRFGGCHAR